MPQKRTKLSIPKPVSIRDRVYKAIRSDVLSGRMISGQRIVEARLAQEIRTSRTPVREALHMLEREGLLDAVPRVGYRVKKIDLDEMEELCEMRVINETLAAQWAIDRISPRDLEALEENLIKAEEKVRSGDPTSFVEYDAEFHEILVRASGRQRLFELCQLLCRHMLRYRIESLHSEETALRAITGHHEILDRVKAKDKEGIASAIQKHLDWVRTEIKGKVFTNHEEKAS